MAHVYDKNVAISFEFSDYLFYMWFFPVLYFSYLGKFQGNSGRKTTQLTAIEVKAHMVTPAA